MTHERQYKLTAAVVLCVATLLVVGAGAVASESSETGTAIGVQDTTTENETATMSVQNLSAPEEVQVGTNFSVSADVVNEGEGVVERVTYRIAGNVVASEFVRIPADNTTTVEFDVTSANTSGFPTGTFTHGVFVADAEATANVTLTAAEETTPEDNETTPEADETTPEDNETTPEANETTPEANETTPVDEDANETTTEVNETTPEANETTPEDNETTPEANETTPEDDEVSSASVTFESQTSNGSAVVVNSVTVPEGGFVVAHEMSVVRGEAVESIVGTSEFLEAGTHQNVTIELDESLNESQRLVAVTYRDSNANEEFDFVTSNRTADGPYRQPDSPQSVNDIANVTVESDGQ